MSDNSGKPASPAPLASVQAGALELKGITKVYRSKKGDFRAVDDTNLVIEPGTFVTLLGPSGCGKTTTLRMIAGFEQPTEGDVLLDGQSILDVTADKRPMSMVFQSYALFPHLSVRGNVEFGLKIKKMNKEERAKKVDQALSMMGIEQYADRYPHQLSGGQQQRVALARALVMEPKIILFDEPLSNLDARLRVKMRGEIRELQRNLGLTAIFVTHDQSEALTMSDVVVVMSAGKVEQVGSPWGIYHRPINRFVASFLGTGGFIAGRVGKVLEEVSADPDHIEDGLPPACLYRVETPLGELDVHGVPGIAVGGDADVVIRAENLMVGNPVPGHSVEGKVVSSAFDGEVVHYQVETAAGILTGSGPGSRVPVRSGTTVACALETPALWAVPGKRNGVAR
ncbi:polyamine ABC transporter ATP-binding protein [Bifidobacterium xylocopae]|uniref:Polyamine ABC transporter ATP-binding protein n=2 Tax=Bifidobacterium xylocopae TaxID=2493119 RepID=A0A366KFM8_9BIFI|nr:polyamine ABC transporter ATP-binding protein [Bifidobacterium xylocopae]